MVGTYEGSRPPALLKLLSHELRWQVLTALAKSDLNVNELVERLNRPQNLVSYHLKQLRSRELVREHRSSSDGRQIYYSLDLDRLQQLFSEAEESLYPGLADRDQVRQDLADLSTADPLRVLFLCTQNSARSQMAEGLLRHRSQEQVQVFSAGTQVSEVRPLAIRAMQEMGIDISNQNSKHLDQYLGQDFNYIITVCDQARESCPVFPGDPVRIHWSFRDPAAVEGSEEVRLAAFRETALQMNTRIGFLLLMMKSGLAER